MRWETQETLFTVQRAIVELQDDSIRPTRQAIADHTTLSLSYIHNLIKRWPDYLGVPGDGTVSILKPVEPVAVKGYRKPRQQTMAIELAKAPTYTYTSGSGSIELILPLMTRIAEALENSAQSGISPVASRVIKAPAGSNIIEDDLHKRLIKAVTEWDRYDNERDKLLGETFHNNLLALYLFYCNIGRYLRKHKAALVQTGEEELKRASEKKNKSTE